MALELWAIIYARVTSVSNAVAWMESTHPELVGKMLHLASDIVPIGSDGVCRNNAGKVQWRLRTIDAQLTETFAYAHHGCSTAAAASISGADSVATWAQPYCGEWPTLILSVVKSESNSEMGLIFQRYVRRGLVPGIRRLSEILRLHSATIEWPPLTWMQEKYPSRSSIESADSPAHYCLALLSSWDMVTAAWDEGIFTHMVPGYPFPLGGLLACIE